MPTRRPCSTLLSLLQPAGSQAYKRTTAQVCASDYCSESATTSIYGSLLRLPWRVTFMLVNDAEGLHPICTAVVSQIVNKVEPLCFSYIAYVPLHVCSQTTAPSSIFAYRVFFTKPSSTCSTKCYEKGLTLLPVRVTSAVGASTASTLLVQIEDLCSDRPAVKSLSHFLLAYPSFFPMVFPAF